MSDKPKRIIVMCAVSAGIDTVTELLRRGIRPAALIGLHPEAADPEAVSGWVDVQDVGARLGIPAVAVRTYSLRDSADRDAIEGLQPDMVLITGWQRLVPDWLIALPPLGVIGNHGSPDGVQRGRGRSPQNWALMLGCRSFELSLFRITPGIDDGPILATRTFVYGDEDDIATSYYRVSLATAEMVEELLANPQRLLGGTPQAAEGHYYPQRRPEDGAADWGLPAADIIRHCRALTKPYPGLRSRTAAGSVIRVWHCQWFDDQIQDPIGVIGPCFESGAFLVQCLDGRLLVTQWSADAGDWKPTPGDIFESVPWQEQLRTIVDRHQLRYAAMPVTPRLARQLDT